MIKLDGARVRVSGPKAHSWRLGRDDKDEMSLRNHFLRPADFHVSTKGIEFIKKKQVQVCFSLGPALKTPFRNLDIRNWLF